MSSSRPAASSASGAADRLPDVPCRPDPAPGSEVGESVAGEEDPGAADGGVHAVLRVRGAKRPVAFAPFDASEPAAMPEAATAWARKRNTQSSKDTTTLASVDWGPTTSGR